MKSILHVVYGAGVARCVLDVVADGSIEVRAQLLSFTAAGRSLAPLRDHSWWLPRIGCTEVRLDVKAGLSQNDIHCVYVANASSMSLLMARRGPCTAWVAIPGCRKKRDALGWSDLRLSVTENQWLSGLLDIIADGIVEAPYTAARLQESAHGISSGHSRGPFTMMAHRSRSSLMARSRLKVEVGCYPPPRSNC